MSMQERKTYNLIGIGMLLFAVEVLIWATLYGVFHTLRTFDPSISLHSPEYLPLAYGSPLISLVFFLALAWKNRAINRIADAGLRSVVLPRVSTGRVILRFILWRSAIALLIIGILGPKVGSKIEQVETRGIDLMIALDVSNSMLAEDLKPNRMDHSKRVVQRLIRELKGDRIGIVIFAGDAYVQLPLTSDVQSARVFLDAINPGIVPVQGTSIGEAIDLALDSFDPQSEAGRMILLITDGEDHEGEALEAAKRASEAGVTISAIGAGLPGGGPIPRYNARGQRIGFRTDRDGKVVTTALNEAMLIDIVKAGDGVFVRSNPTGINLAPILDAIAETEKGEIGAASYTDHEHLFHSFVVIALMLLLLERLIGGRSWKPNPLQG